MKQRRALDGQLQNDTSRLGRLAAQVCSTSPLSSLDPPPEGEVIDDSFAASLNPTEIKLPTGSLAGYCRRPSIDLRVTFRLLLLVSQPHRIQAPSLSTTSAQIHDSAKRIRHGSHRSTGAPKGLLSCPTPGSTPQSTCPIPLSWCPATWFRSSRSPSSRRYSPASRSASRARAILQLPKRAFATRITLLGRFARLSCESKCVHPYHCAVSHLPEPTTRSCSASTTLYTLILRESQPASESEHQYELYKTKPHPTERCDSNDFQRGLSSHAEPRARHPRHSAAPVHQPGLCACR